MNVREISIIDVNSCAKIKTKGISKNIIVIFRGKIT